MTGVVLALDRLKPVPTLSSENNCVVSISGDRESSRGKSSSSRDAGCSSSTLCERCSCSFAENDCVKEGKESDTATYISIVNSFQEKVHTLQKALLTANQCSVLSRSTELSGDSLTTSEILQKKNFCIKGHSTRRRRTEWTQAVDANNAMHLLQHVSASIHPDNFEKWKGDSKFSLLGNVHMGSSGTFQEGEIQKDEKHLDRSEDFEHVIISSYPTTEGPENSLNVNNLFVDPVILVDITATMNKQEGNSLSKSCNTCVSRHNAVCEEIQLLTSENVKLREMHAEAQRELDAKSEEIRVQKMQLEELRKRVDELSHCNAKMQEDYAVLQCQHDEGINLVRLSEAKTRETTAMIESISSTNRVVRTECEEAQRDAEVAWKEVHRLEGELRGWSQKERELQRLRVLMRFSELKKDSDKLSGVVEEIGFLSDERKRLNEENRRCRTLLSEYRQRLEQNDVQSSSADTHSSCTPPKSADWDHVRKTGQEKGKLKSSELCVSDTSGSQVRNMLRAPSRPASALRVREGSHRRSVERTRRRCMPIGRPPLGISAFPRGDGGTRSLFESRGGCPNRHQSIMGTKRSKSCKNRSLLL